MSNIKKEQLTNESKTNYELIKDSNMFDWDWFVENYSLDEDIDPILFYLNNWSKIELNPSPNFNSSEYLKMYNDVEKSGLNPLVHYVKFGKNENRLTRSLDYYLSSINIVKEFEEYNDKPVCIFGVLLSEMGKLIREEMLSWLKPLYNVYVVEQNPPGKLFEFPAIRFMQYICQKDNIDYCLYLHSKGAGNPNGSQKNVRNFWKYEFTNYKEEYINYVDVNYPTVSCPFTGKSKITWNNGFYINLLALNELDLTEFKRWRHYYENMFTFTKVNVIGRVYNDIENVPESRKRAGTYIQRVSYYELIKGSNMFDWDWFVENCSLDSDYIQIVSNYELIKGSNMFDWDWFVENYSLDEDIDPILFYLKKWSDFDLNPSPNFNSSDYLKLNKDVEKSGMNPLVHYVKYGKNENRRF